MPTVKHEVTKVGTVDFESGHLIISDALTIDDPSRGKVHIEMDTEYAVDVYKVVDGDGRLVRLELRPIGPQSYQDWNDTEDDDDDVQDYDINEEPGFIEYEEYPDVDDDGWTD